jgi:hypothetical protein
MRQWISLLLVETGVIRLDWVLPYEFHLPPPPSPRDDRSDKKVMEHKGTKLCRHFCTF